MRIVYIDCFLGFDASMLLGALIDAGAEPVNIENKFKEAGINVSLSVKATTRSSIECKKVSVLADAYEDIDRASKNDFVKKILSELPPSENTNEISALAVLFALEALEADYIVTSEISLGDNTDGNVLAILSESGIETIPSECNTNMMPADAILLSVLANECGPKPDMDIISIGYGAGGHSTDEPNIVSVIIGSFDGDYLMEFSEREELIAML